MTTCTEDCGDVIKAPSSVTGDVKNCWDDAIDNEAAVKDAKKNCANNGDLAGSFSNCMKAVKSAAFLVAKCSGGQSITTVAPGSRRFRHFRQFFK